MPGAPVRGRFRPGNRGRVASLSALALLVVALPFVGGMGRAPVVAASSCASEAPDAASASALASACNIRVENLAGRSERTQAFVNPDGTSTFVSSVLPARVQRSDGSWVGIDTRLLSRPDGSFAPFAASADVTFSGGGSGPFVTYRQRGEVLTLSWPTALPKPSVSGATATYANVMKGVDLRVTATATGFRHVLVVKSAGAAANPALARIRYQIGGDGKAKSTSDGHVSVIDRRGRTLATTSDTSMWDSSIRLGAPGGVVPFLNPQPAADPPAELMSTEYGPGATAASAELGVSADGANALTVVPDATLLTGSNTVYPVFISPQISPQIGPQRSKWAWANNADHDYEVGGQAWAGLNPPAYGGDGRLYRSFFDFPTTYGGQTYKGKHVLEASFSITLTHSYSCAPTPASLFRVGGITVSNGARMPWSTRPLGSGAMFLASASGNANKTGNCSGGAQPNTLMTFGRNETMRADVQHAADSNWNGYTVGLCACDNSGGNEDESVQDRWKRFLVDNHTTMSVTYNTVPGAPANLSPHQGQAACGGVVGTSSPVLQARYVDADGDDTLSATFKWQDLSSTATTSVAGTTAPANNNGTAPLNLGAGAEGKSYQFQVQTFDGHDRSPWSPWCKFTVDTIAPLAPVVTAVTSGAAPVYTPCDPGSLSSCVANGGPGVAGAFKISEPTGPAGQDVVKYVYGWDSPSVPVTVAAGGAAGPVLLTPPHYGINTLVVYAVDASNKQSPSTVYRFLVRGPSSPQAYWPLDTIDGHNFVDLVNPSRSLTAAGVTWTPDARYVGKSAATFDANGAATEAVSAFDTSGSFSVAAWARLSSTVCSGNQTVVSVDGDAQASANHTSGLLLSYDCTSRKWKLRVPDRNAQNPSTTEAASSTTAAAGKWTFLVGTWDEDEHKIRLYVNGTLNQELTPPASWLATRGSGWKATGAVTLGRDRWNDANDDHFVGEIADVRLWNRVVTTDDITGTDADAVNGIPAQVGLASPLQVGWWPFADGEAGCSDAADASKFARRAFVSPNCFLDPNWNGDPATAPAWLTMDSHDGDGGLRLDGLTGYASTTDDSGTIDGSDDVVHSVLRTDQSFTMSAWVKPTSVNGTDQLVLRQGNGPSAVKLGLRGSDNRWTFAVSTPDGAGGYTWVTAKSDAAATAGVWTHLVGEFDASVGLVRIYVDGQLQVATMTGGLGWNSTGSLLIGTVGYATFFSGVVDQVQTWQGLLNGREIRDVYDNS